MTKSDLLLLVCGELPDQMKRPKGRFVGLGLGKAKMLITELHKSKMILLDNVVKVMKLSYSQAIINHPHMEY